MASRPGFRKSLYGRFAPWADKYAYCGGDPINASDPSGLLPPAWAVWLGVGLASEAYTYWSGTYDTLNSDSYNRDPETGLDEGGVYNRYPLELQVAPAIIHIAPEAIQAIPRGTAGTLNGNRRSVGLPGSSAAGAPHRTSSILIRGGEVVQRINEVSGQMTAEQRAMGYPKGQLASHTEPKTLARTSLQAGDVLVMKGTRPPCPSCRGYMNRAASEFGATVHYVWGNEYWSTAGGKGLPGQR